MKLKVSLFSFYSAEIVHLFINKFIVCKGAAKLMYTAVQAFGCKAYQDSQTKHCVCRINDENHTEL